MKRVKSELQSSRAVEQELRSQINTYTIGEKGLRSQISQLHNDNENLQNK